MQRDGDEFPDSDAESQRVRKSRAAGLASAAGEGKSKKPRDTDNTDRHNDSIMANGARPGQRPAEPGAHDTQMRRCQFALKGEPQARVTAPKTDETTLLLAYTSSAPWSSTPSLQRYISLAFARAC